MIGYYSMIILFLGYQPLCVCVCVCVCDFLQGQTAGHYATTYQFFDFAEWLYDADGAAANDSLQNIHQLGPYDGLSPDVSSEDHQLISEENSS